MKTENQIMKKTIDKLDISSWKDIPNDRFKHIVAFQIIVNHINELVKAINEMKDDIREINERI